jgi:MFS family permease
MINHRFHENVSRRRPDIDYLGAGLVTLGLTLTVLGLLEGGQTWPWDSAPSIAVLATGAAVLVAFGFVEARASDPVVPLWVFRRRLLVTTSLVSFGVGAVLIGLSSYVPTFVQDVLGTGPLIAGFALAALTLGWPLSGSQSGRLYLRIGVRSCALIGVVFVVAGSALLLLLGQSSPVLQVAATCFAIGLGMGLVAAPTLIAAQSTVQWRERGVVTGTNLFCRSLGSAIGVAIFGAVANGTLGSAASGGHVRPAELPRLDTAVHHVFIAVVGVAALMALMVVVMPQTRFGEPARQPEADQPVVSRR